MQPNTILFESYQDYLGSLWSRDSLREAHIKSISKIYYDQLILETSFLNSPAIRQRVWHAMHSVLVGVNCPVCHGVNKWHPDLRQYRKFCSTKCSAIGSTELRESTNMLRYGVPFYSKLDKCAEEVKKTSLAKFGVDHYTKTDEYLARRTTSNLEKYGVEHVMQLDSSKDSAKKTYIDKYGVDHPWKVPEIRGNIRNTCEEKYGDKYPSRTNAIKTLMAETNMQRYGVDHYTKTEAYALKREATCLVRYGVPYSSQMHLTDECLLKYNNQEWLTEQHHILEKPVYVIADELGMSASHLCKKFHSMSIEIKHFYKSEPEKQLYDYVQSLDKDLLILSNDRKRIHPHELDIFIPSLSLAIEYCGVFYHSESVLRDGPKYHINKLLKCKAVGIRLIQIFEHEWINKPDIVKSILSTMITGNNRIYARKCSVKDITHKCANEFYNMNHIQGAKPSSTNLGLFHNGEIVACMSFSKSRLDKYEYELTRFAAKRHTSVVGGASKLFKFFIDTAHPTNILSYCDQRIFTGNIYKQLNFKYLHTSSPNYFYFYQGNTTTLFSREVFQKKKLSKKLKVYDPSLSEWQNMKNNKYNRIWDCGNMVFEWRRNDAA